MIGKEKRITLNIFSTCLLYKTYICIIFVSYWDKIKEIWVGNE